MAKATTRDRIWNYALTHLELGDPWFNAVDAADELDAGLRTVRDTLNTMEDMGHLGSQHSPDCEVRKWYGPPKFCEDQAQETTENISNSDQ